MIGAPSLSTNQKREQVAGPPFALTAAENGLSVDPVTRRVVLGNDIGAPGSPAQLLSPREILSFGNPIEIQNAPFGTGGQAVLGLSTDGTNGVAFCGFWDLQLAGGSIVGVISNSVPNSLGAVLQFRNGTSGQFGVTGNNAAILPAKLRNTIVVLSDNVAGPNVALVSSTGGTTAIWSAIAGLNVELYRFLTPVVASLNFPLTAAQTSSDLTVNVPGAADGDQVNVGAPVGSIPANCLYTGFVSAPGVVTVRFCNFSAAGIDPAVGNFNVAVTKLLPP